jgi:hypothetical protein
VDAAEFIVPVSVFVVSLCEIEFCIGKRNKRYRIFVEDVNADFHSIRPGVITAKTAAAELAAALCESDISLCEPLFHKTVDTFLLCV